MSADRWSDRLVGSERFTALYPELPALERLVLGSVHLSPYGPAVTLRVEFPDFPEAAPPDWVEAGCDRFEAQLEFPAAGAGLRMRGIPRRTPVDVVLGPCLAAPERRFEVAVNGPGFALAFTAHAIKAGHLNAYRSGDGDPATVRRRFASPLDQRLHRSLPATTAKVFFEHV